MFTKAANRRAKQGPRHFHLTLPPITTIGANDTTKRDETRLRVEENNWSSPSRVIIAEEKERRVEARGRQWGGGWGLEAQLCCALKTKIKKEIFEKSGGNCGRCVKGSLFSRGWEANLVT